MAITAGQDILAADFISSSAGAADSGKGPKLNSRGTLDGSFDESPRTVSYVAGESITAGQAVSIVDPLWQMGRENIASGATVAFGDTTGKARRALRIKPQSAVTIASVDVWLRKVGSPSDNITIEIQTETSGSPSGTAVTNGTSGTLAGTGLTTNRFIRYTLTFATPPSLSSGTNYWVVIKRSGAADGSNYYQVDGGDTGGINNGFVVHTYVGYADFTSKIYDSVGATWGTSSATLMYAHLNLATGTKTVLAYKSVADYVTLGNYVGIALNTVTAGQTVEVLLPGGLARNLSGLTPGASYYVKTAANAGDIGTTASQIRVGVAVTATTLRLDRGPRVLSGALNITNILNSAQFTGFPIRSIRVIASYMSGGEMEQSFGTYQQAALATAQQLGYRNAQNTGSGASSMGVFTSLAWELATSAGSVNSAGTIDDVSDIGFSFLQSTLTVAPYVYWEAIGF